MKSPGWGEEARVGEDARVGEEVRLEVGEEARVR